MVGFKNFPNSKEDYKYWREQLYAAMRQVGVRCALKYRPRWERIKYHERQGMYLYNLTNKKEREIILQANRRIGDNLTGKSYGNCKKENSEKSSS